MVYVIIDIDGVLNPFGARYNSQLGFTWLGDNKEGFFLEPEMHTRWITKISEHAEFVWGSAWAGKSNLVLDLLNINETWDFVPLSTEDIVEGTTWKLASVQEWIAKNASGEKVVWLDDELEADAFSWAEKEGNMLLIRPDRYRGLTEKDFEQIFEFVQK